LTAFSAKYKSDNQSNPSNALKPFTRLQLLSKMNSNVDYTPVLLAQLTDLQMRVTKQDATITALKAEVERLTGHSLAVPDTMRTSVPLRSHDSGDARMMQYKQRSAPFTRANGGAGARTPRDNTNSAPRPPRDNTNGAPRTRPKVASFGDKPERPTMSLSDVLIDNEMVTIQVGTGKDSEGKFTYTTATATFDGTDLTVTECDLAKGIIGMKSSKPGEILYKFIDELKSSGHINRTFTIAPWKLCFVERDGVRKSLEELRNTVG
jgi:hypothetical protein